jgi:hypothetical protein
MPIDHRVAIELKGDDLDRLRRAGALDDRENAARDEGHLVRDRLPGGRGVGLADVADRLLQKDEYVSVLGDQSARHALDLGGGTIGLAPVAPRVEFARPVRARGAPRAQRPPYS